MISKIKKKNQYTGWKLRSRKINKLKDNAKIFNKKGKNESIQQAEHPAHRRPFDVRASESGGKLKKKKRPSVQSSHQTSDRKAPLKE